MTNPTIQTAHHVLLASITVSLVKLFVLMIAWLEVISPLTKKHVVRVQKASSPTKMASPAVSNVLIRCTTMRSAKYLVARLDGIVQNVHLDPSSLPTKNLVSSGPDA